MDNQEKQRHYAVAEQLLYRQNFAAAVIAGAVATVLAAAAYGVGVSRWPFSYGFAAAGVGIVIGLVIGFVGRGIAKRFALLAGLYTVIGCALGNVFRTTTELARARAASTFDVLQETPLSELAARSMATVSPVDLVYLLIAVFAAGFFARRSLSRSEYFAIRLLADRE
jgi:hypothetical protein